jgi:exodeoxyribonuclease III
VKLISWNINGLRAALARGSLKPVARQAPDILCLQEVRAGPDQVGQVLKSLPYQLISSSRRPGYSGTAILSRTEPLGWEEGMGHKVSDDEGRVLTAEFPTFFVTSVYVPNSQRGLGRLDFRIRWDGRFRAYLGTLAGAKPVIFCGDLNVAHQEMDIARPRENRMNAGFTDRERRSFGRLLGGGFLDTFRTLHPAEKERYTWWSLATAARARNIGWRIDYVCVSPSLRGRLKDAFILDRITGSDHCPVGIVLDGEP